MDPETVKLIHKLAKGARNLLGDREPVTAAKLDAIVRLTRPERKRAEKPHE